MLSADLDTDHRLIHRRCVVYPHQLLGVSTSFTHGKLPVQVTLVTHLGTAAECVEHVEQHEAGKRHCGISWRYDVVTHLKKTEHQQGLRLNEVAYSTTRHASISGYGTVEY